MCRWEFCLDNSTIVMIFRKWNARRDPGWLWPSPCHNWTCQTSATVTANRGTKSHWASKTSVKLATAARFSVRLPGNPFNCRWVCEMAFHLTDSSHDLLKQICVYDATETSFESSHTVEVQWETYVMDLTRKIWQRWSRYELGYIRQNYGFYRYADKIPEIPEG